MKGMFNVNRIANMFMSFGSYFYFRVSVRLSVLTSIYFWIVMYELWERDVHMINGYMFGLSVLGCLLSMMIGVEAVDDLDEMMDIDSI